jgi:hypothetical protein
MMVSTSCGVLVNYMCPFCMYIWKNALNHWAREHQKNVQITWYAILCQGTKS